MEVFFLIKTKSDSTEYFVMFPFILLWVIKIFFEEKWGHWLSLQCNEMVMKGKAESWLTNSTAIQNSTISSLRNCT